MTTCMHPKTTCIQRSCTCSVITVFCMRQCPRPLLQRNRVRAPTSPMVPRIHYGVCMKGSPIIRSSMLVASYLSTFYHACIILIILHQHSYVARLHNSYKDAAIEFLQHLIAIMQGQLRFIAMCTHPVGQILL